MMQLDEEENAAIKEMEELPREELIEQIKEISLSAWQNYLETITLKAWLNNFNGEALGNPMAEQNLALWLAVNFVFYTDSDVRSLSKNLWWKYIHKRLEEYERTGFMMGESVEQKHKYIMENTVIQPLGNCSGSGTNVCFLFRHALGLNKEMFELKRDFEYEYLVLVDDVTVSGWQAEEFLSEYDDINAKERHILTYISTKEARERIGDKANLLSAIELDSKSKCFDENSYVFSRYKNWIKVAKKMCKYYGKKIDGRNPYGYRNGQYLFGFYYNIPNNTLPIFWGTINGWTPLFNRFFCNYDESEEVNSEKFF